MIKALIVSLGGSPAGIIKSILHEKHLPEFVCFLVSHETVSDIRTVENEVLQSGHRFNKKCVIIDDSDDLVDCYRQALICIDFVTEAGYSPDDTFIDFTGGKKTMSVGLAIAALGKGYAFSYVSGTERTKNGKGIVVNGTETVKRGVGPWQIFAVEEKKLLSLNFNGYRFGAALDVLNDLIPRCSQVEGGGFIKPLKSIVEGYSEWEAFRHGLAREKLSNGVSKLKTMLDGADSSKYRGLREFLITVQANLEFLNRMASSTRKFEKLDREMVVDLMSNAQRRAEGSKFDDATTRVYRALEMMGQIAFLKQFGVPNDDVPINKLPLTVQDGFRRKYQNKENATLKLPMEATFRALQAAGNPIGRVFIENLQRIKKLQDSRNYSILAHGNNPVKQSSYEKFSSMVRELFVGEEEIKFPKLSGDW